jgi:cytosine/adenosine deaminase-related metal-dependent hydrolase
LPYFDEHKIIAVHNTYANKDDLDFAGNINYCICLNANLYIENKVPPLELLMSADANIIIGTDSLASNQSLNMWNEIQSIQKHFPDIEVETILKWATSNGASALNINEKYGSFQKGKSPGVVLINDGAELIVSP